MRDEEDASRHPDTDRGAAADGALTLHAEVDAALCASGSGFAWDRRVRCAAAVRRSFFGVRLLSPW
jgi:hypothetical protein